MKITYRGVELVFDRPPTRAALEEAYEAAMAAPKALERIEHQAHDGHAPMSGVQHLYWILQTLDPQSVANVWPQAVRIRGPLDKEALRLALTDLVAQHEVFRTVFPLVGASPQQQILPPLERVPWREWDLSEAADPEEAARAEIRACNLEPFDLVHDVSLRFGIMRLADDDHVLLLVYHHIAADEWTTGLVVQQLPQLYTQRAAGGATAAPQDAVQYADFASWERRRIESDAFTQGKEFWAEHLRGQGEMPHWPVTLTAEHSDEGPSATVEVRWGADFYDTLQRNATDGVTPFVVLYSAFTAFLWRYCGQPDVTLGIPATQRSRHELQGVAGNFLNIVPLRATFQPDDSFDSWVRRSEKRWREAQAWQWISLGELLRARSPESSALFDVTFTYVPRAWDIGAYRHGDLEFESFEYGPRATQPGALDIFLARETDGVVARFNYNAELFSHQIVEDLAERFRRFALACMTNRHRPMLAHQMTSPAERQKLLSMARGPQQLAEDGRTASHAFEQLVIEQPGRIALYFDEGTWTYATLGARVDSFAAALLAAGVKTGDRVGVSVARSPDLVASLLAVMKVGAAYVPVEPKHPASRLETIAEDAQIAVVVCDAVGAKAASWEGLRLVRTDDPGSGNTIPVAAQPDLPAYVIYTSGSTGRPKGVVVPHHAVWNHLRSKANLMGYDGSERVLCRSSYGFDASVTEMFVPLTMGGALVLVPEGGEMDPNVLLAAIQRHDVDVVETVPTALRMMADRDAFADCVSLKTIVLGGEALDRELVSRARERLPGVAIYNPYGPTEATVETTMYRCEPDSEGLVPIGRPMHGYHVALLADLDIVPPGFDGELHITGVGLADGYFGNPRLTATTFVPAVFGGSLGARMYRSGDLARWVDGDNLVFRGRRDHQLQVRGVRIELGEVESTILRLAGVGEVVVVPVNERDGRADSLIAYIVPEASP